MPPTTEIQELFFVMITGVLVALSWHSLQNPRSHGFYRFFGFEFLVTTLLLTAPHWLDNPFSPTQIFSWLLLLASIVFAFSGFLWLIGNGKTRAARHTVEKAKVGFEKNADFSTAGIFKYIRHPLYGALLFLDLSAFLKSPSLISALTALMAVIFLAATAKVEDRENLLVFGDAYAQYMRNTKNLIPFLF
jgi:protein-S-isoprenylcysteine O-methyltransferase Ste14